MQESEIRNRLLQALPSVARDRLLAASVQVNLPVGTELFCRAERPRFLFFLTSGIASVVFTAEDGATVELSTKGTEGLIGWAHLLGSLLASYDCTMQVAGTGYRIPLAVVQQEFDLSPAVRQRMLEYAQHQYGVANQVAACNRLHQAKQRFVRWLLMVSDRLGSDDLPMTQEFMSTMLGTRRTTVAEVSAELARAGAVEGRRGGLRIVNRAVLEAQMCECYPILRKRYLDLYRDPIRDTGPTGS